MHTTRQKLMRCFFFRKGPVSFLRCCTMCFHHNHRPTVCFTLMHDLRDTAHRKLVREGIGVPRSQFYRRGLGSSVQVYPGINNTYTTHFAEQISIKSRLVSLGSVLGAVSLHLVSLPIFIVLSCQQKCCVANCWQAMSHFFAHVHSHRRTLPCSLHSS